MEKLASHITEREKFEKWWPALGQTIGKVAAWEAWQAALSAAPTPPDEGVIDFNLDTAFVEQVGNAAWEGRYKDVPPEFCLNDLLAEICNWLRTAPPEVEPVGYISSRKLSSLKDDEWGLNLGVSKHKDEITPHAIYISPPSPKAEYDDEGNPLNLLAAARDFIEYFNPGADVDRSIEQVMEFLQRYEDNLRRFIQDQ